MNLYEEALHINNKLGVKKNYATLRDKSIGNYLSYRLSRPFLKLSTRLRNQKFKFSPWTSPASVAIFDKILRKDMIGLEYGSGFSTVFFAERLKKLVSIEHHKGWYGKIQSFLTEHQVDNVEYLLREPHERIEKDWAFKGQYNLNDSDLRVKSMYSRYFETVNEVNEDAFDFILIDGRARVECFLNSLNKLKKGGFIVLDNSERLRYKIIHELMKDWKKVHTTNGLTDTTFWFK